MLKKKVVDMLQNVALATLTVTAVLLIARIPMLDGVIGGRVRDLLSSVEQTQRHTIDLADSVTAVHFAVTDDVSFGRYTKLNALTSGADFQRAAPLLREAIGSAAVWEQVAETQFRNSLSHAGVYIDLMTVLPVSVVAAWLGEEVERDDMIRAMALTTEEETAGIYFLCEDGMILRCASALSSKAVCDVTGTFQPNGGCFAFETEYSGFAPYMVMVRTMDQLAQVNASLPAGYSAFNLLTALEFNPHTYARYVESGGTEVVLQSPHVLRIDADGTVRYNNSGIVEDNLYRISSTGEVPTVAEVLYSACLLAEVLSGGTDASPMSLDTVEKSENGWIISFCYRVDGVLVRLKDDRCALRIVVTEDTITEFNYYCRSYTATQENSVLLPVSIAVALAVQNEGTGLSVVYVDGGTSMLGAHWLVE